jgi:membrane protease YdiL (CAAX protease family)
MGLGLAPIYLWRRDLVALIGMHAFQDFGAVILLALPATADAR